MADKHVSKIDQLDQLDKAIKDAHIKYKSIETNIEQIDKEIAVLSPRKSELEQNIEFHKSAGTVPIAHEYKKAKAELSKVTARLIFITADQKKAREACKQIEQIVEKLKRDHTALLKTSDDNILRPIFGGTHGKR